MTADKLRNHDQARIVSLSDSELSLKLMEMGCVPGIKITYDGKAPFGDPLKFIIGSEYSLSLRKSEAALITVVKL